MNQQTDLFSESRVTRRRNHEHDNARVRKRNGQYMALKKAGSLWVDGSMKKLRMFIRELKIKAAEPTFTFEAFRARSEIDGWPLPASVNAWGALPALAIRAGLIEWTGQVENAKRPGSRARLVKAWRAL